MWWYRKIPTIVKEDPLCFSFGRKISTFETVEHGLDIFRENIPKIPEMFNFWQVSYSTENSGNSARKIGSNENSWYEIFKSLGILREVVLVFRSSGKCCFIHHQKFRAIQTTSFGRMEHAFDRNTPSTSPRIQALWTADDSSRGLCSRIALSHLTKFPTNKAHCK